MNKTTDIHAMGLLKEVFFKKDRCIIKVDVLHQPDLKDIYFYLVDDLYFRTDFLYLSYFNLSYG